MKSKTVLGFIAVLATIKIIGEALHKHILWSVVFILILAILGIIYCKDGK